MDPPLRQHGLVRGGTRLLSVGQVLRKHRSEQPRKAAVSVSGPAYVTAQCE